MGPTRRALVLGGGGVTGIAWELGLLAGLAEKGVDLMSPDVVVGTSAGSVVGAQVLSGTSIEELYAEQLADATGEIGTRMGPGVLARFVIASLWPGDERRGRAYLGHAALAARTVPESKRRTVIESRLRSRAWPARRLLVTAVDAETGEARVFDRAINGRRYVDGGVRSIANADLAAGCDRVVVLAPVTFALRRRGRIASQLSALGPGVRSVVVSPDAEARRAIGRNVLDPARRAASARAGRRQAGSVAGAVGTVWANSTIDS